MTVKKIGELNGKWAILFKIVLAMAVPFMGFFALWATWVTMTVTNLEYMDRDKFTGAMFIEVQDQLDDANPDVQWLSAKEIREIQVRHLRGNGD